ncbi:MAG: hypothetical protein FWD76_03835 [Firmicutes bacterium]|nr:hypothetical protein [Bacillota bacterium]
MDTSKMLGKKIVEKRTLYLTVFGLLLVAGLVMAILSATFTGRPFNFSKDFVGGYTLSVQMGERLTDDTVKDYQKEITGIIENTQKDGKNVRVISTQRFGKDNTAGIQFVYNAVGDQSFMDELGTQIVEGINAQYFANDPFAGIAVYEGYNGPSIGGKVIFTSVLALILAMVILLIYLSFRYNFVSGLATLLVMVLDIAVVFALAALTRFQIGSSFVVAIIATMVYSILSCTLVFDRIREELKEKDIAQHSANQIANAGIQKSLGRSLGALVVGLAMTAVFVAVGGSGLRLFALPLLIGILSSSVTSIFVAPSLFAMVATRHLDLMQKHAFLKGVGAFLKKLFTKKNKKTKKTKSVASKNEQQVAN